MLEDSVHRLRSSEDFVRVVLANFVDGEKQSVVHQYNAGTGELLTWAGLGGLGTVLRVSRPSQLYPFDWLVIGKIQKRGGEVYRVHAPLTRGDESILHLAHQESLRLSPEEILLDLKRVSMRRFTVETMHEALDPSSKYWVENPKIPTSVEVMDARV